MTIEEIRNSAIIKRAKGKSLASEFNELRRDPDLLAEIRERFPFTEEGNLGQALYHLIENKDRLECICGKTRRFHKLDKGYFETCGDRDCINLVRIERIKKTSQEKYGVDHPTQLNEVKEKQKKTMLERYGETSNFTGELRERTYAKNLIKHGVKHALQRSDSKEKRKRTTEHRYGTLNFIRSEKAKATNRERYGTEDPAASGEIKEKIHKRRKKTLFEKQEARLLDWNMRIVRHENDLGRYHVSCDRCKTELTLCSSTLNAKLRIKIDPCTVCNPPSVSYSSRAENEIADWISSLGEKVIIRDRTTVSGHELDINLVERGIGFEFNGLYWHSELHVDRDYHQKKTEAFLEKGIRLYHIWEDDWASKKEIIKARILSLLGRGRRIGARSCDLRSATGQEAREFFEKSHIDGHVNAKRYYAGTHNGEIVGMMSFSRSRFDNGDWELIRFATQPGLSVPGLASRILKRFIDDEKPSHLLSYAKVDWTPDPGRSVYHKLGFQLSRNTGPGMYWVVDGIRRHRLNFTKKKLVAQGKSAALTGTEIMHESQYYRLYDAGNWRFELSLDHSR